MPKTARKKPRDSQTPVDGGEAREHSGRLQTRRQHGEHNSKAARSAIEVAVKENKWWPFDRADGKLLNKINTEQLKQTQEQALW